VRRRPPVNVRPDDNLPLFTFAALGAGAPPGVKQVSSDLNVSGETVLNLVINGPVKIIKVPLRCCRAIEFPGRSFRYVTVRFLTFTMRRLRRPTKHKRANMY
jgi:hypothetical protein